MQIYIYIYHDILICLVFTKGVKFGKTYNLRIITIIQERHIF